METILLVLVALTLIATSAMAFRLWGLAKELEERMDRFTALSLVPDRLQALARVLEDLNPPELRAELDALRSALGRVEDLAASPIPGGAIETSASRPVAVRALIIRHLREEGCRAVRILDEDEALSREELEVRIECLRDGTRVLGTVRVLEDAVIGSDLASSYTMFP